MKKKYYLKKEDKQEIARAKTFNELKVVALRVMKRMYDDRGPLWMVCGPISTGGTGSTIENLKIFEGWIKTLLKKGRKGLPVFSQMPFERAMDRIERFPGNSEINLLEAFYLPLFSSGMVEVLAFIPGWETSFGASWEHEQAERLHLTIVYVSPRTQ